MSDLPRFQPDFGQFMKVLRREVPDRPVLHEIMLNHRLEQRFCDPGLPDDGGKWTPANASRISAWKNLGYDYCNMVGSAFGFPKGERAKGETVSLNEGALITDRASFDAYPWPDPDAFDYSAIPAAQLPAGMKLTIWGPGGVLENVIGLTGYDTLCFMTVDDPGLVSDLFEAVGSRLVRYYELVSPYDTVGAVMANDDWGFKTQPMLSPAQMREYVIPWHARIAEAIHAAGKPALLHSCGNLESVMDDIIDVCRYDAKHSWEDAITPVEEAYERWGGRIAILGGMDVDFVTRGEPDAIRARAAAMLEQTAARGGYALGTGNSVPEYVPDANYLAMIGAAHEGR